MTSTTLTIGVATYRDFDGLYFTLNSLRLAHSDVMERCEIVIVDNDPDGPHADNVRGFHAHLAARRRGWLLHPFSVQYIPYREATGTAGPRDHIFQVAKGDAVVVVDSHVNLWPNALARLLDWYDANPESNDLVQGPLVYDDLATISTHFADVWRDGMWGTWDCDERGVDPDGPSFEIPAQGLGLFSCRRSAWLGFNREFREFGGEEWYIHEKFRQAGRRCLCLPFLRWIHRFSAPAGGRTYPLTVFGKIRNYILGLQELNLPLDRLKRHYVDGVNEDPNDPVNRDQLLSDEQFSQLVQNPHRYPICFDDNSSADATLEKCAQPCSNGKKTCRCNGSCMSKGKCKRCSNELEILFRRAADNPSDLNEHCDELRRLSKRSESVVEFGMRHKVSTVALLAGQPKQMLSVITEHDPILDQLKSHSGQTQFEYQFGTSLETEIPECDLLFLDTKHTGDHLTNELNRLAPRVRNRIAIHDTDIYGEQGEDGAPGLLPALRDFLRRQDCWRVIYHTSANYGMTVISRDPEDVPLESGLQRSTIVNGRAASEMFPMRKELRELKACHQGEDIYVIGSAASMDYFDPDFFADRIAIGCNQVFRKFPVRYSIFQEGAEDLLREAAEQSTLVLSRHPFGNLSFVPRQFAADFPHYYVFPHRLNEQSKIDWTVLGTDEIIVSSSVVTSAMHIAAYFGAKNLFLCGVDGGRLDGRLNYAGYQAESQSSEQEEWYQNRIHEIASHTMEVRDRLLTVYGCRTHLLSPFVNFRWEGHQFEP